MREMESYSDTGEHWNRRIERNFFPREPNRNEVKAKRRISFLSFITELTYYVTFDILISRELNEVENVRTLQGDFVAFFFPSILLLSLSLRGKNSVACCPTNLFLHLWNMQIKIALSSSVHWSANYDTSVNQWSDIFWFHAQWRCDSSFSVT